MKTTPVAHPSAASSAAFSSSPAPAPSESGAANLAAPASSPAAASPTQAVAPSGKARPGRPSYLTERIVDELCAVIRETGASDSGAAGRVSLHPSTVSRWKREYPELVIALRSAREEFRMAHLELIMEKARAGEATSWRAAAWLLERIFPEDYSPRARERALFQERFDALCAAEEEGGALGLPDRVDPLQIVKNPVATPTRGLEAGAPRDLQNVKNAQPGNAPETDDAERPLQNVKNSAGGDAAGIHVPAPFGKDDADGPQGSGYNSSLQMESPENPLQNVKNSMPQGGSEIRHPAKPLQNVKYSAADAEALEGSEGMRWTRTAGAG
jgi:hypothetical protein